MATLVVRRNLPYIREQIGAAVGKSSVVVKFVAIAVTLGYFISFAKSSIPYVTVTPGYVMPPNLWVWTYATHCFIEFHFWDVLCDIAVIVLFGKLLEPLWGAYEMLVFFAVVNVTVALLTSIMYIFFYFITRNQEYIFDRHVHGLAGYIAGFSVAVKQIMPDHVLMSSPFGKLRNTHIPLLLVTIVIVLRLIQILEGPYAFMFMWGTIVSWTYLRFYQKHTNGNRGDMADNFNVASFFPNKLQPVISILANSVFNGLVKIKVCKKPERRYDISSPSTITVTLPGTDPQDAERRRLVALKALNERLSKADPSSGQWPSMDSGEDSSSAGEAPSPTRLTQVITHSTSPAHQGEPVTPTVKFPDSEVDDLASQQRTDDTLV